MGRGADNTAVRLKAAISAPLPLILQWHAPDRPLPVRAVRHPARVRPHTSEAPPWHDSGPADAPFDFCGRMRRLCADLVARCEPLRHIDLSRILFTVTQARSGRAHGLQARVTPLRFRDGALTRRRRHVVYQVQRYFVGAHEILYLVTFCLPRFLNLDFDEKLVTLFHELFHISPACDGDLRRHGGRYSVHSHSQRLYDQHMAALAREYLSQGSDPQLYAFLRLNFAQLLHRHGRVVGTVVPRPKLVPAGAPD
jgi:hypothetical protein